MQRQKNRSTSTNTYVGLLFLLPQRYLFKISSLKLASSWQLSFPNSQHRFSTSDWTSEGKPERDETNPAFIRVKGCSSVWMLSSWRFLLFYPGTHKNRPVSLDHLHLSALCLILALMEESIISSLYRGNSSCICTEACFSGDVQPLSVRMRQEVSLCLRVRTESP